MFVRLGAASGFVGIALGAFGAHALKDRLSPVMLEVFQTGVLYQLLHSVALVALGALRLDNRYAVWAGRLFAAGIVLFSGSLYALAWTGAKPLGAVTPFGGVCLLGGWAALFFAAIRSAQP